MIGDLVLVKLFKHGSHKAKKLGLILDQETTYSKIEDRYSTTYKILVGTEKIYAAKAYNNTYFQYGPIASEAISTRYLFKK